MKKQNIVVRFLKTMTTGSLTGIVMEETLSFATTESAMRYIDFLKKHEKRQVQSVGGGNYKTKFVEMVIR